MVDEQDRARKAKFNRAYNGLRSRYEALNRALIKATKAGNRNEVKALKVAIAQTRKDIDEIVQLRREFLAQNLDLSEAEADLGKIAYQARRDLDRLRRAGRLLEASAKAADAIVRLKKALG